MKVKRIKKAKRVLNFFHFNYQYNEPYSVLVDGTFCQAALENRINLREQFPKYFGCGVEIFTTKCVLKELSKFLSGKLYSFFYRIAGSRSLWRV
jgi:U3 small nucleolar RNA-associated protein 23